ncbi:MAG: hypothetical protein HKN04_03385 [Rhodothermaceae bacterium]|nr:hypothetical protein [Rhodothermaceae bacterium]
MRFIRTKLATDCPEPGDGFFAKLLRRASANPDYEPHLHQVSEWLIEFDDDGHPGREVGLDEAGRPVVAGPDEKNYGFWLDTNMKLDDFEGESISREAFEEK